MTTSQVIILIFFMLSGFCNVISLLSKSRIEGLFFTLYAVIYLMAALLLIALKQ